MSKSARKPGQRTPPEKAFDHYLLTPLWDWVAALLFALCCWHWWRGELIDSMSASDRHSLFQTVTSTSATLFGFTMTSLTLLLNNIGGNFAGLANGLTPQAKARMHKPMFALIRALAALLLWSFGLLLTDVNDHNHTYRHLMLLALVAVVVLRINRSVVLLARAVRAKHA